MSDESARADPIGEAHFRLALIVESSSDAIIGKTLDGIVTDWNTAAERLYGYSAQEMVGTSISRLLPPDRPNELPSILERLRRGERVEHYETVRVRKDGTRVDVSISVSPITDTHGGVLGAASIARDITELKRAEAVLQAGDERFRRIVETAREGIWALDDSGLTTFVNPRLAEILGYAPGEMLGRSVYDFVDEQDRAATAASMEQRRRGVAEPHDLKFRRKDGAEVWTLVSANPLVGDAGRIEGDLAIVADITERKRAEEAIRQSEHRFRGLIEHSWDVVTLLGADGTILYSSPATTRLLGYPLDEFVGRNAFELLHPDDQQRISTVLAQVLEHPAMPIQLEVRVSHKDGSWPLMEAVLTNLLLEPGVQAIVSNYRDITARREAERQLEALARSETMRALGQMASGIAHDLNQSLGLVVGHADLAIAQANLPEAARDSLQTILKAAESGAERVKRLLRFGRAHPEGQAELVQLGALLREVAQLTAPHWRDEAQAQGRAISLHVEAEGDLTILGWTAALSEALTNLVFNAADALPRGGTIRLAARREGERLVVEIADSGEGMSAEVQARIFEPFYTTKGERGTGLGLPMVFGIVERHGGQIDVRSSPGEGTTFRLSFPAAGSEIAEAEAPAARAPLDLRGKRILVVDDEARLAQLAKLMLQPQGHHVTVALSGEEALERLEAEPFDLVLSDVGMGEGINGWELAARVRLHWPEVRFALATGWGAAIDVEQARAAGVEAVIAKPYRAADLLRVVAGPL